MRDMFVELLDAKKCKIYKENEFEELLQKLKQNLDCGEKSIQVL